VDSPVGERRRHGSGKKKPRGRDAHGAVLLGKPPYWLANLLLSRVNPLFEPVETVLP